MALNDSEVREIIGAGESDKVVLARKWAKKNNMHLTGKGVAEFIEKLDPYENNAQNILKKKLAQSNRMLFSFLLRPMDKIFTAKGGSVDYNLDRKNVEYLKANISDVADGLNIKKYLKKVVRKNYLIDPNSMVFIDIDERGMVETYIVKSNEQFWYKSRGNSVEAVIFAPYQKPPQKDSNGNEIIDDRWFYRVIDEKTDRIYVQDGDNVYMEQGSEITNYFGFVPAIMLGDEKCPNNEIFESIIADVLEEADKFLRDVSIMNIHDLAHLYPRYWAYAQACTRCEGEGYIAGDPPSEGEQPTRSKCTSCGGDGIKKQSNPSDEIIIPQPYHGDKPLAPHIAGFVSPDINTARFYRELQEGAKNSMFHSFWGTTYEGAGKRETATGRYLDAQPVNDRLGDMSDTFAKIHKFMLDCYGMVLLRRPNYESSVSYGKRYIFEGADDILDKYVEVSREKVSDIVKSDLQRRYLEAEYQDDKIELVKRRKLSKIEPFPSLTVSDVLNNPAIPNPEKLRKLYFMDWVNQLSDAELVFLREEQLREGLLNFINSKQLQDGEKATN